jgi:hypothetical protein
VVEREFGDVAARIADPAPHAGDGEEAARDGEDPVGRQAHQGERDAGGGQQREDRRAREVDLLAGRRHLILGLLGHQPET